MKLAPPILKTLHNFADNNLLNKKDPEAWHKIAMEKMDSLERMNWVMEWLWSMLHLEDPSLAISIWNIEMKNPVWVAAGFVKQPHGLKFLEALWFWYITIWGITVDAQDWNLPPRIIKMSGGDIVNAAGLPWPWWDATARMLEERKRLWMMPWVPIIANLCNSKSAITDEEQIDEFMYLMEIFYPYVEGFEVNVSCPNQKGVTKNQDKDKVHKILKAIQERNESLALLHWCDKKAIILKVAPMTKEEDESKAKDLTKEKLQDIADVCNELQIDAITATNTSAEHDYDTKIMSPDWSEFTWWRSWLWLHPQSLATVAFLKKQLEIVPILWVWGIWYDKWQSWVDMINAWATWIELYSSLVKRWITVPYYLKKAMLENKFNY